MLYTWNMHSVINQCYLNKRNRNKGKKVGWEGRREEQH